MFKPGDLYLSIVDLFAIIIPGGLLIFSIYYNFGPSLDTLFQLSATQKSVALFLLSYFFGHVIAFFAERIDKSRGVNWITPGVKQSHWEQVRKIRAMLDETMPNSISIYQWSRSVLMNVSPESMSDVNRIVASTDFYRNLYLVFPLAAVFSFAKTNWVLGGIFFLLTFPCLYFSASGRHKLHRRIGQHIVVLYNLGKLRTGG
ncbi:MAG: hypothetical protein AAGA85_02900 [Bacteroidota bacterium]